MLYKPFKSLRHTNEKTKQTALYTTSIFFSPSSISFHAPCFYDVMNMAFIFRLEEQKQRQALGRRGHTRVYGTRAAKRIVTYALLGMDEVSCVCGLCFV